LCVAQIQVAAPRADERARLASYQVQDFEKLPAARERIADLAEGAENGALRGE